MNQNSRKQETMALSILFGNFCRNKLDHAATYPEQTAGIAILKYLWDFNEGDLWDLTRGGDSDCTRIMNLLIKNGYVSFEFLGACYRVTLTDSGLEEVSAMFSVLTAMKQRFS